MAKSSETPEEYAMRLAAEREAALAKAYDESHKSRTTVNVATGTVGIQSPGSVGNVVIVNGRRVS